VKGVMDTVYRNNLHTHLYGLDSNVWCEYKSLGRCISKHCWTPDKQEKLNFIPNLDIACNYLLSISFAYIHPRILVACLYTHINNLIGQLACTCEMGNAYEYGYKLL